MNKITVVSYCHPKHIVWLPHWMTQIDKQTDQNFDIFLIAHNWKTEDAEYAKQIVELGKSSPSINRHFRFRTFHSEPIIGNIINYALDLVETEYFAHWDIDDIFHSKRIELQSKFLNERSDIDFLNARAIGFTDPDFDIEDKINDYDQSNEILKYLDNPAIQEHDQIRDCLFNRRMNCLSHGLMIYKTKVLRKIGGFSLSDVKTDGKSPDESTWIKAIQAGYRFHRLPERLMGWRLNSSSIRTI